MLCSSASSEYNHLMCFALSHSLSSCQCAVYCRLCHVKAALQSWTVYPVMTQLTAQDVPRGEDTWQKQPNLNVCIDWFQQ